MSGEIKFSIKIPDGYTAKPGIHTATSSEYKGTKTQR